jgi:hypothetical protein
VGEGAWRPAGNRSGDGAPGHLGVLRFIFTDDSDSRLEEVSWDDWFKAFDARSLLFHFQEHKKDGQESNFFKLENPND